MTKFDKKVIASFVDFSVANSLDFIQGLPAEEEHTQFLFYKRLCENLGFCLSNSLDNFERDSLLYEKCINF